MMSSRLSADRPGPRRNPKRARLGRFNPVPTGVDKFSSLPTPLTHQIMSLLSIKDSIQMSSVSKHFLATWRSFPMVDFNFVPFALKPRRLPEPLRRFAEYVVNSLPRRVLTTDLERFSLIFSRLDHTIPLNQLLVQRVASFVLENKVRELSLDFLTARLPGLPLELFSSPSLRKLKLSGFFLTLETNSLVLNSPKIQDFKLLNCTMSDNPNVSITLSSPSLRAAHIDLTQTPNVEILIIDSSRRSLESLIHLGRCQISNLSECRLIRTLELHHFEMANDWFQNQLCSLTVLQSLTLKHCRGPERFLLLNNNTLQVLDMEECVGIEEFELVALNLRVLRYWSVNDDMDCYMNFEECNNLRQLILRGAGLTVTSYWVASTVFRFELLEKMVLSHCNLIDEVILTAPHLRVLELINCVDLRSFDIDAPNLQSIVIDGKLDFDSPTIFKTYRAHLDIRFKHFNRNSFKNLLHILPSLSSCRSVTLSCYRDERFIFPIEDRAKVSSPMFKLLRLEINVVVKVFPTIKLIENMLWLCPHPMTLTISINRRPHVIFKFNYKFSATVVPCARKESLYCHHSRIKCWRHFLDKLEVETYPSFTDPWESVESFFRHYAINPIFIIRQLMK